MEEVSRLFSQLLAETINTSCTFVPRITRDNIGDLKRDIFTLWRLL